MTTEAPLYGLNVTRPELDSTLSASRTGVFDTPSRSKVVVAVVDPGRGPVFRTVHPDTLTEREDEARIKALIREHVAGYKAPKRIVRVDSVGRAPNGKVDHKHLREVARSA